MRNRCSCQFWFVEIIFQSPLSVTAVGAPVGGVLFSIEVTSTYYPLRNYWLAYLSSISGAVLFRYLWNLRFGNRALIFFLLFLDI